MSDLPVVLVTGGSRGIGRAICDALAPDHQVIIGGRDRHAVHTACADYTFARAFVADLADERATGDALDELGLDRVDGLVHSAGVLGHGRSDRLSRVDWRNTLELNVIAVADVTRQLLPALRAARGTVVLINSGSGLVAHAGGASYAASKFALRAYGDALREEERPHGVRVTSVHPGRTSTDMQRDLRAHEGGDFDESRYLRPESVAAAVRLAMTAGPDATVESLSIRPGPAAT